MAKSSVTEHPLSNDEALYHLLKKEHSYYKAILNLTRHEHVTLKSHQSPREIHALLKRKKTILASIRDIEKTLVPLKKYWMNEVHQNPNASKINELLTTLCNILEEILDLDCINQKLLKDQLTALNSDLQKE